MAPPSPIPSAVGVDAHVHVFDASAPVRAGHYEPVDRTLADIEGLAERHGIGRLVLVQPSVYGTDNSVMLQALASTPGRHRGVAVVHPDVGDAELDRLHAAGVRGVRFNLVSPVAPAGDPARELVRLAPRLRERGWHVQWHVQAEVLPALVAWQAATGLQFVLDHLGGLNAGLSSLDPAWEAARALAAGGAWVKLSGWYRLAAPAPYAALQPVVQRVAALFGTHMVWGSDWPHTSFAPDQLPAYASMLEPVRAVLGEDRLDAMLHGQARTLYF